MSKKKYSEVDELNEIIKDRSGAMEELKRKYEKMAERMEIIANSLHVERCELQSRINKIDNLLIGLGYKQNKSGVWEYCL